MKVSTATVWVAPVMLQSAAGNPQMAFASINYALAIWADADPKPAQSIDFQYNTRS